jgi:FkbM family methyltransferase
MIASKLVGPEGRVYAFEPEPRLAADLIENCHLNRTDNVEVLPVALSNEDKETTLYTDQRAALGIHKLFSEPRLGQHGVTVKAQSGDTLVTTGTAAQPSVVKVDVEGWEFAALKGMAAILGDASCRLLLLEVHSYYLHNLGYDVDDLRTLIEGFGFQIVHEDIRHTIQETGIKAEQRHWICQKGEQATNSA